MLPATHWQVGRHHVLLGNLSSIERVQWLPWGFDVPNCHGGLMGWHGGLMSPAAFLYFGCQPATLTRVGQQLEMRDASYDGALGCQNWSVPRQPWIKVRTRCLSSDGCQCKHRLILGGMRG